MKTLLSLAGAAALAVAIVAPARAQQVVMVAGWDFSQYAIDGFLSVDGENLVATLPANYSNFDPTYGAGAESAAFGTLYLDGSFGSTATPLDFTDTFVPSAAAPGSLVSNQTWPVQEVGQVPFDTDNVLTAEQGQAVANPFAMIAQGPQMVVFEADLSSVSQTGTNWLLSFAGKTSGGTSAVTIDFSTTGAGYTSVGQVELNETDTQFVVDLGPGAAPQAYVRLGFNPIGLDQPFVDNVAISLPEPGAGAAAALLALGLLRRVRVRR
jgi:hypothetical protein